MAHEVVAPDKLDACVQGLVDALLLGGPHALASASGLIRANTPIAEERIEATARLIAQLRAGDEAREGLAAFLSKRKPSWQS